MSMREKIAATSAAVILLVTIIYWASEIKAVAEVLQQAYG